MTVPLPASENAAISALIRLKLRDGRLPHANTPKIYGAPGVGGRCDACDKPLAKTQLAMSIPWTSEKTFVHLHADCYELWRAEMYRLEAEAIRLRIHEKLTDGRLPYNSIPRFWGGPANGEVCDACDTPITKEHLVMAGITSRLSDKKPLQFHVRCFYVWDSERRTGDEPTCPSASTD